MIVCYTLTMPGRGSWNGAWSAEHRLHVVIRSYNSNAAKEKGMKVLNRGSYRYDFGDGWCASVTASEVDGREAMRLRRRSAGFSGYEWMIDSIEQYGEILNSTQRKERAS